MTFIPNYGCSVAYPLLSAGLATERYRDQVEALSIDLRVANDARERAERVVVKQHEALHTAFALAHEALQAVATTAAATEQVQAELNRASVRITLLEAALLQASEELLVIVGRGCLGGATSARVAQAAAIAKRIAREGSC